MRREDEIERKLEWARERSEDDDRGRRYWVGMSDALEWALTDDPLEEKFGKRHETCPVKDVDCDEGPFYGPALLLHIKEAHPEAYSATTADG